MKIDNLYEFESKLIDPPEDFILNLQPVADGYVAEAVCRFQFDLEGRLKSVEVIE